MKGECGGGCGIGLPMAIGGKSGTAGTLSIPVGGCCIRGGEKKGAMGSNGGGGGGCTLFIPLDEDNEKEVMFKH